MWTNLRCRIEATISILVWHLAVALRATRTLSESILSLKAQLDSVAHPAANAYDETTT